MTGSQLFGALKFLRRLCFFAQRLQEHGFLLQIPDLSRLQTRSFPDEFQGGRCVPLLLLPLTEQPQPAIIVPQLFLEILWLVLQIGQQLLDRRLFSQLEIKFKQDQHRFQVLRLRLSGRIKVGLCLVDLSQFPVTVTEGPHDRGLPRFFLVDAVQQFDRFLRDRIFMFGIQQMIQLEELVRAGIQAALQQCFQLPQTKLIEVNPLQLCDRFL